MNSRRNFLKTFGTGIGALSLIANKPIRGFIKSRLIKPKRRWERIAVAPKITQLPAPWRVEIVPDLVHLHGINIEDKIVDICKDVIS